MGERVYDVVIVPLVLMGLFGLSTIFVLMLYYRLCSCLRRRREATLQQPPPPQEPEGEECYLSIYLFIFSTSLYRRIKKEEMESAIIEFRWKIFVPFTIFLIVYS
jgi:hypothetical protein